MQEYLKYKDNQRLRNWISLARVLKIKNNEKVNQELKFVLKEDGPKGL